MKKTNFVIFSGLALVLINPTLSFATGGPGTIEDVSAGVDPTAVDTSVKPCDDFYQYACGNWEKRTVLPSDHGRWTRSFNTIDENNLASLRLVLEKYSNAISPGKATAQTFPGQDKLGKFYLSCVNTAGVEGNSKKVLQAQLAKVDQINSKADIAKVVADLHMQNMNVFFAFGRTADLKKPTIFISEIDQGGYTLPDSTYYKDAESKTYREAFKSYLVNTYKLLGDSEADAELHANQEYAIEEALVKDALPSAKRQDPTLLYHPSSPETLAKRVSAFDWSAYFSGLGIKTPKTINLTEKKVLKSFERILENTSLSEIKSYLRFQITNALSPLLGQEYYSPWFAFNKKALAGQAEPQPRWKECVDQVGSQMGEALGRAYVEQSFSENAKARAKELIGNLTKAYEAELETLPWLDKTTRAAALLKLSLITQKIGFPEHWRDYSSLSISKRSYAQNVINSMRFENRRQLDTIGGTVDPMEWGMTPQQVNAYYDPSLNQINFPAGILQPPFFSAAYSDALNYGAIGMVIGHEMSHGFDTVGRKFDGHGVNNSWWTKKTEKDFMARASCLESQYSKYEVLPANPPKFPEPLYVGGHLTVTENIADNGGLTMAFKAYQIATKGKPAIAKLKVGDKELNGDQQFFLSTAQGWCTKANDDAIRKQVKTNPHSPSKFRINGPMQNNEDFATAFGCSVGTPMAPANRCLIW